MIIRKLTRAPIPEDYEIVETELIPFKNWNLIRIDEYDYVFHISAELESYPPIYRYEFGRKKLDQPRTEEIVLDFCYDDGWDHM